MKKILIVILLITGLTGCSQIDDNQLKVNQSNYLIEVNEYMILETNAADLGISDILWNTSNAEIATVVDGVIYGVGPGAAVITAEAEGFKVSATIIVTEKPYTDIKITGSQTVFVGNKITLGTKVESNVFDNLNLEWTSSDNTVATVISGVVTGRQVGVVTIKATLSEDSSEFAEYVVLVRDSPFDQIINTIERSTYEVTGELSLELLSSKIVSSVQAIGNAFVGVSNFQFINNDFNLAALGSGIVYHQELSGDKYLYRVLTNEHVIEDFDQVKVYLGYLNKEEDGTVIKQDANLDLAIVEFKSDINITPVTISSSLVNTGDFVIAIGNPTGYEYFGSVTFGIVSQAHRIFDAGHEYIQHDASINSGNSGGPLLNLKGELIGINTLKLSGLSIEGMGFAIPLTVINEFIKL
mgnify:CR=1 FL=1